MPEEWLAARDLSDSQLEALAKVGDKKAQMFFIDRASNEISPILASGKGLDSSPQDTALFNKVTTASTMAMLMLESTKSPFAAYMNGRLLTAMTQYNPPEVMASRIMLAGDLGDPHAKALQDAYLQQHPSMDAAIIASMYSSIKKLAVKSGP